MPITTTEAPPQNASELRRHLTVLAGGDDHFAVRSYDLTLDQVMARQAPDRDTPSGWRHVVRDGDGTFLAADLSVSDTGTPTFLSTDDGPHVAGLVASVRALHEHVLVVGSDYEIAYLRVASCGVTAIWGLGDGHDHEMVVPLAPAPPELSAGRSYRVDAFLDALAAIARRLMMGEDDLTRIEGVGHGVERLLHESGVFTFADVAARTAADLESVLDTGGPRFNRADPTTWPEQAALAAAARWEELDRLQRTLTGGRVTGDGVAGGR